MSGSNGIEHAVNVFSGGWNEWMGWNEWLGNKDFNRDYIFSLMQRIKYPLYDLEFETGKIISPVIYSRNDWESRHKITPFYKNVKKEGILLLMTGDAAVLHNIVIV